MSSIEDYLYLIPTLVVIVTELYFVFTNTKRTITAKVRRQQRWVRATIGSVCLGLGIWLFGHFTWTIWD